MQIVSFSPFGYEGSLVTVEVDLRRGIPTVDIVGLADGAVKESRERMRAAIGNSGFNFPVERVLISLSPADLKKEGAGFDLAVALAVLSAQRKFDADGSVLVMGELELSGNIRPVRGVHAAASTAAGHGIMRCIIPFANGNEAREVSGMQVYAARTLVDAFHALCRPDDFSCEKVPEHGFPSVPGHCDEIEGIPFPEITEGYDLKDVSGQPYFLRGLQIAAAGGHNLLAFGPPGCGKTLALQRFGGLLPLLTVEESQPVTRIYSLAGILSSSDSLIRVPPFRMPHQTTTIEGMCGGGPLCKPGEISLAHNGVLFLDEASEFRTSVLQMLRVPLESGNVTLCRAGRSTTYPASFQLLLAANPCPCGNFGSKDRICLCSMRAVELYWKKISGPLLDRIDMRIRVESGGCTDEKITGGYIKKTATSALRPAIAKAVRIQRGRQGKRNAMLSVSEITELCCLSHETKKILDTAADTYCFSPRAVVSCLKLARTIADMEGAAAVGCDHMAEAVSYRKNTAGIDTPAG